MVAWLEGPQQDLGVFQVDLVVDLQVYRAVSEALLELMHHLF
jgi:hypothetical protein